MALAIAFSRLSLSTADGFSVYRPKMFELTRTMSPRPFMVFSTTSGLDANTFALGLVVATSQQIADLDADPEVWARELPLNWRTLTVADIPLPARQKMQNRLAERNINHGIVLADTLPQAFDKIIAAVDGNYKTLAEIEATLLAMTGVQA